MKTEKSKKGNIKGTIAWSKIKYAGHFASTSKMNAPEGQSCAT
jgi:hypothetical protein